MKRMLHYSAASILAAAVAGQAQAAGTIAGTAVNNQASIAYTVGGVSQPSVTSNTASFVVDRRVNLTVAEFGGTATTVAPGSTARVTTFSVTNTTNSPLDFRLVASQVTTGAPTPNDVDNFDVTNLAVYVDSNGNGTYEVGTDTAVHLDEMAADASISVFVVADIPAGRSDADTAGVILTATAAAAGGSGTLGADMVQTTAADTPNAVDTVFGDGGGVGDVARDGKHSDDDEYEVTSATVTLSKTSTLISDPHNSTTNPKAIPGAVLEYCIKVQNTGRVAADAVVVTDLVPANTTYTPGTIRTNGTVNGSGVCQADGAIEDDDSTGLDETDPAGGSFSSGTVRTNMSSVAAGATVTARFRVTVN